MTSYWIASKGIEKTGRRQQSNGNPTRLSGGTQEASHHQKSEAGGCGVSGQHVLHLKFKTSIGYIVWSFISGKKNKQSKTPQGKPVSTVWVVECATDILIGETNTKYGICQIHRKRLSVVPVSIPKHMLALQAFSVVKAFPQPYLVTAMASVYASLSS